MCDYKPKGKELKLAREVDKLLAKFRKMPVEHEPHDAHIEIGHTLDGVRCNGWERVVSLHDVKKSLREYVEECKAAIREREQALKFAERIIEKMEIFRTCQKCKGKKGRWTDPERKHRRGSWQDCSKCEGRGILF